MKRFLYSLFSILILSNVAYSQTFFNGGNPGNIISQYCAPRHIQYVDNYYYNYTPVIVQQVVPFVVQRRIDVIEYNPVYVEYNWLRPSTNLPNRSWYGYQPYYFFPYRY